MPPLIRDARLLIYDRQERVLGGERPNGETAEGKIHLLGGKDEGLGLINTVLSEIHEEAGIRLEDALALEFLGITPKGSETGDGRIFRGYIFAMGVPSLDDLPLTPTAEVKRFIYIDRGNFHTHHYAFGHDEVIRRFWAQREAREQRRHLRLGAYAT